MKYFTSALVIAALCCANNQTNAIHLKTKTGFTDDLVKSLAEDMGKDLEEPAGEGKEEPKKEEAPAKKVEAKKETKKEAKKDSKKEAKKETKKAPKKEAKKEDDEIPMDAAAIKAYSSVIADAAEDSEPQQPVIYHQVASLDVDENKPAKHAEGYNPDPMGSMIQNEISSIKDASIKAAKEKDE